MIIDWCQTVSPRGTNQFIYLYSNIVISFINILYLHNKSRQILGEVILSFKCSLVPICEGTLRPSKMRQNYHEIRPFRIQSV